MKKINKHWDKLVEKRVVQRITFSGKENVSAYKFIETVDP